MLVTIPVILPIGNKAFFIFYFFIFLLHVSPCMLFCACCPCVTCSELYASVNHLASFAIELCVEKFHLLVL